MQRRPVGNIPVSDEDYPAKLLAHGFDTWVETFNVELPDECWHEFEGAQRAARAMNASGEDRAACQFGGHVWQISPWGGGGAKYIMTRPDVTLAFRSRDMAWNLTARFLSVGLWADGWRELRKELVACLERAGGRFVGDDQAAASCVSRIDYAFDFLSERFTGEARPELLARFVQPQQSKGAVYTRGNGDDIRAETFRIGKMPRLQIELYDKGREIKEASGKEWFRKVWGLSDDDPLENIWRIECRFGSEFLKDRNVRTYHHAIAHLPALLASALVARRLTVGNATRARRADMHPLWRMAWEASKRCEQVLAIDRVPTLARKELLDVIEKQMAGLTRARSVLQFGAYADDAPIDAGKVIAEKISEDKAHSRKVGRVQERYRFLDEGR
jgi:hypothetical protein